MSYVNSCSHCLFRTKDPPREWLNRPSGTLAIDYLIPPLKGWAILESPLREMSVGNSSSDTTAHGRKMSNLYAPLGSEFSCPETEMFPLKTTENPLAATCLPSTSN